MSAEFDYDILIVGSGFGGSVSALRLAEKGWKVGVLEMGRRLTPEDFEAAAHCNRALTWMPALGMTGFFAQEVFRHVAILRGIGVGGGSNVYGAVLLEPKDAFYRDPAWAGLNADWRAELAPHYATARRMLGIGDNPYRGIQDRWLEQAAWARPIPSGRCRRASFSARRNGRRPTPISTARARTVRVARSAAAASPVVLMVQRTRWTRTTCISPNRPECG